MAAKQKNSLVGNISRRKQAGASHPKVTPSLSNEAYSELRKGWPKSHRPRTAEGRRKTRRRSN
jgi:hypothetical protein